MTPTNMPRRIRMGTSRMPVAKPRAKQKPENRRKITIPHRPNLFVNSARNGSDSRSSSMSHILLIASVLLQPQKAINPRYTADLRSRLLAVRRAAAEPIRKSISPLSIETKK